MWYFAYGSNLCRTRLTARVASARYDSVARLSGHEFRFHKQGKDGSGKADAFWTGSPDDAVWGVLVELEAEDLAILDRFEPRYERRMIELETAGQSNRAAHSYFARPTAVDPSVLPFAWYRRLVVEGGAARGLPDAYLAAIAALPARSGPEPLVRAGEC